jgi:D-3-phosphoglycerate dehydrogenase
VARRAQAFGLKVTAYEVNMSGDSIRSEGAIPALLDDILKHSDFVSVHIPHTDETRHLISEWMTRHSCNPQSRPRLPAHV